MNISAELMMKLARACGAPVDANAEGVVRVALERLGGEREYWVEVYDGDKWQFYGLGWESAAEARATAARLADRWKRPHRAIELIKRVLPP